MAVDESLDAAADALDEAADALGITGPAKSVAKAGPAPMKLWNPFRPINPVVADFVDETQDLLASDTKRKTRLATRFGLTTTQLDRLLAFRVLMEAKSERGGKAQIVAAARSLPARAGRSPVVIGVAATAISDIADHDCTPADVAALMAGTSDRERDLWLIATACQSTSAYADILRQSERSRNALLWVATFWSNGEPAAQLAGYDLLLDPSMTARIPIDVRPRFIADKVRGKLQLLYRLGMFDEGLAFADTIDRDTLALAFKPSKDDIRSSIDGFDFIDEGVNHTVGLAAEHAAVLALAGRTADAKAVLDGIVPELRRIAARACLPTGSSTCIPGRSDPLTLEVMVVDQFLTDPHGDPFALLEYLATDHSSFDGPAGELFCRIGRPEEVEGICKLARDSNRDERSGGWNKPDQDDRKLWKQVTAIGGPPFARNREIGRAHV